MTNSEQSQADNQNYQPPEGAVTEGVFGNDLPYETRAQWTVLRKKEKPVAEIFHVAYLARNQSPQKRPITFAFNGGPGAAAAFLHLGAMGPHLAKFNEDGSAPPPPAELLENPYSWLPFTDLVFVDPVGTGFSRTIDHPKKSGSSEKASESSAVSNSKSSEDEGENREFYALKRDLDSLAEMMQRFLSENDRWRSPIFIAGESYGGFRVAKLAKLLQESYGIGLNGAILVSPALEFQSLDPSDYDILSWIDTFPSMAATAAFHGKSQTYTADLPRETVVTEAIKFANNDLVRLLIQGEGMPASERESILQSMANQLGLPLDLVTKAHGRITQPVFVRNLLRDQRQVCGLYDATIKATDPFPDREQFEGPDPTLFGIDRVFSRAVNVLLREVIGVKTDRTYHLLSLDINRSWQLDYDRHVLQSQIGATDDLRYGMALNPHMKVYISHGYYDLVTPFQASNRIVQQMKLDKTMAENLQVRQFGGGHMFYIWSESRSAFWQEMKDFYSRIGALSN
ncbi:peptidase S10 [Euhalothece natronophila Z-M001]|uniref:Peptidase S10 n=1 Tax=Euhalothece natronophila Z-M001 TaxID=522448 RepID=A0A5B8NKT3_9CHRO|nr:peptidase S10 [Euhalothece natronophila]QDZ39684.1 peptidase S10 [Euhalothece natronophila Z-M001]